MKFRATVERSGKTATGVEVPAEVVDGLGDGKHPKVRATIGGHTASPRWVDGSCSG